LRGLDAFEAEISRRLAAMREAADRGDASTLARAAALLRAQARALGADRCVEACRELETLGRQGTLGDASVFLAQLEDELDRLRVIIGALYQTSENPR
jgi:HPt (histidine-containing phosphotransfer) domain-containing protein